MYNNPKLGRRLALVLLATLGVAFAAAAPAVAAESPTLSGVVNVNTATSSELQLLPGIGEARAKALIDTRKRNGGFKSVDELLEESPIGLPPLGDWSATASVDLGLAPLIRPGDHVEPEGWPGIINSEGLQN